MFSIALDPTYSQTVSGTLPGGLAFEFEAIFRRLSASDLKALDARIRDGASDEEVIGRVLAGWRGVTDEDGADLVYSPESLFRLLNIVGVARAILKAFFESLDGGRLKN